MQPEHEISLQQLITILSFDVVSVRRCVELNFGIEGYPKYEDCWLGKMKNEQDGAECYWFGLVKDGSEAYGFPTLTGLLEAKVFEGKSLKDVLPQLKWYSLDGSEIPESISDQY